MTPVMCISMFINHQPAEHLSSLLHDYYGKYDIIEKSRSCLGVFHSNIS
jgi:hypothetical protein